MQYSDSKNRKKCVLFFVHTVKWHVGHLIDFKKKIHSTGMCALLCIVSANGQCQLYSIKINKWHFSLHIHLSIYHYTYACEYCTLCDALTLALLVMYTNADNCRIVQLTSLCVRPQHGHGMTFVLCTASLYSRHFRNQWRCCVHLVFFHSLFVFWVKLSDSWDFFPFIFANR